MGERREGQGVQRRALLLAVACLLASVVSLTSGSDARRPQTPAGPAASSDAGASAPQIDHVWAAQHGRSTTFLVR